MKPCSRCGHGDHTPKNCRLVKTVDKDKEDLPDEVIDYFMPSRRAEYVVERTEFQNAISIPSRPVGPENPLQSSGGNNVDVVDKKAAQLKLWDEAAKKLPNRPGHPPNEVQEEAQSIKANFFPISLSP